MSSTPPAALAHLGMARRNNSPAKTQRCLGQIKKSSQNPEKILSKVVIGLLRSWVWNPASITSQKQNNVSESKESQKIKEGEIVLFALEIWLISIL